MFHRLVCYSQHQFKLPYTPGLTLMVFERSLPTARKRHKTTHTQIVKSTYIRSWIKRKTGEDTRNQQRKTVRTRKQMYKITWIREIRNRFLEQGGKKKCHTAHRKKYQNTEDCENCCKRRREWKNEGEGWGGRREIFIILFSIAKLAGRIASSEINYSFCSPAAWPVGELVNGK